MARLPDEDGIPTAYLCSLTLMLMKDPVVTADGYSYDRSAITRWLEDHNTSPRTGAVLPNNNLIPNVDLRLAIEEFEEKQTSSIAPEKLTVDETPAGVLGKGAWVCLYCVFFFVTH